MLNKRLYSKITYITIAITFLILMVISSFYDLRISKDVYYPNSFFANFFDVVGEIPYYISLLISTTIIFNAIPRGSSKKLKAFRIISVLSIFLGAFFFWYYIAENMFDQQLMFYSVYVVYFSLITTPLMIVATKGIDKKTINKLIYFAVFLLALVIVSRLTTGLVKIVWSRLRFGYMDFSTYDGFTPWWMPNLTTDGREQYVYGGYNDTTAFRSFISGHTTAAGALFSLIILPDLFPKLNKNREWFYAIPALYTGVVAISRIVAGAHFLSDVLVAFVLSFTIASFLRWLYIEKNLFINVNKKR